MRRAGTLVALVLAAWIGTGACLASEEPALDELLARAAQLTAQTRHAEAYALLSAEEDNYIGAIAFDYALGRAALHAGRPDRATLAFARVLALDPGHAGARIDTGRAYLALGNRAQAEAVFESLLALDPPPALRAQLLAYLATARVERRRPVAARGYLSLLAGRSSNVNQAPGQGQVFVPALLAVLQLADQNVAKDDSFVGLGGGVEGAMPLSERRSLIGSAEFLTRANSQESDFDVGGLSASGGLAWRGERHVVRAQAQGIVNTLGGRTSREVGAVSLDVAEIQATAGAPGALFGFAHAGGYRHPADDLKIFDADFVSAGAGWTSRIGENSTYSVAFMASEDRDRGGNPSGDRRGLGARVALESLLAPKWRAVGLLSGQNSRYEGFDAAFLAFREDRRVDMEAYLRYQISGAYEARIGVLRSVQDSNIPIYEFRRTDWWLMLRRNFE